MEEQQPTSPIYQIKGIDVTLFDCYNIEKTYSLIDKINKAYKENLISEEEKNFLCLAASRFTQLFFKNIAEYYSKTSKEMQQLMEELNLIVIDYGSALEKAYFKIHENIKKRIEKRN